MDRDLIIDRAVNRALENDFSMGVEDCATFACDIACELTGIDLMKSLPSYSDDASAFEACGNLSLVAVAYKIATENNLQEANFPWEGILIGVIAGKFGPTLAIFYKDSWIARSCLGVSRFAPSWGVVAWRLPCLQQ